MNQVPAWLEVLASSALLAAVMLVVAVYMGRLLKETRLHNEKMEVMRRCTGLVHDGALDHFTPEQIQEYFDALRVQDYDRMLEMLEEVVDA